MLYMARRCGYSNCYSYQATDLKYYSAWMTALSKYFHGTSQIRSSPACVCHSELPDRACTAVCCLAPGLYPLRLQLYNLIAE